MVPDSPDVQAVLLPDDGVFAHAQPGTLIIDFSSIRPDVTAELAKTAAERGLRIIDAPVSGGEPGAVNATLSIMVGGTEADFAAAKPIFDVVGKTIAHVGPNGSGQTVKAANQLIVAGNIELLAEAITFLRAYGVDIDAAVKVLGGGLAGIGGARPEGAEDVVPQLRSRIPHRPSPQGHGHRHLGGPRGRRRHPTRRGRRTVDGVRDGQRRRRHSTTPALLLGVERLSGTKAEATK